MTFWTRRDTITLSSGAPFNIIATNGVVPNAPATFYALELAIGPAFHLSSSSGRDLKVEEITKPLVSSRGSHKNGKVLRPARAIPLLTVLLVGGCGSPPHRNASGVPDWEDARMAHYSAVSPAPALAPPASDTRTTSVQAAPATAENRGSNFTQNAADTARAKAGTQPSWVALQSWARASGLPAVSRLTSAGTPSFSLRSGQETFEFRTGSQAAQWAGLEIRLGFAPQWINEQPYLNSIDLEKTVLPLLKGAAGPASAGPIVLDPGHGGEDSGTTSAVNGCKEKELTLDWANRVKAVLEHKGLSVILTRSNDANVPLSDRVIVSQEAKAALFVSLHFNSTAGNPNESGIETYCLTPPGAPSTITRNYQDDPAQTFPNNAFDVQNVQLAASIHRALIHETGRTDRGVRRARFLSVLRGQQCPAVLIEGGYLSNPLEARKLSQSEYRQQLAEAVAGAVESWVSAK